MALTTLKRTIAYGMFGCLLLLIYQVVFMTRTSASRDWNHLHSTKFTLPSLQRYVLHNVDESRILKELQHLAGGELKFPSSFKQMSSLYSSRQQKDTQFIRKALCDNHDLPLSPYWQIFGVQHNGRAGSHRTLSRSELSVAHFDSHKSVDDLVDEAISSGKEALLYIVPDSWVPHFGLQIYAIPVLPIREFTQNFDKLEFELENASSDSWRPSCWEIPGFSYEKLIIGDSRGSPESTAAFLEVARVFQSLTTSGWKPLRTIQFISFPHYGAKKFVEKHRAKLQESTVVYLDSSELDTLNSVSASPTLLQISDWVLKQLVNAELIPERHLDRVFSAPLGSNAFLFDLQISSISVAMTTPVNQARVLALLLATLSQDAILPLRITDYAPFIPESSDFGPIVTKVDKAIEALREAFTREHPWYELTAKIRTLAQRKRVNLVMSHIERLFNDERGKHLLFGSDNSGTRTIINKNHRELVALASRVSQKLQAIL